MRMGFAEAGRKVRGALTSLLAFGGATMAFLVATPASGNERHFVFTYESATLPAGAVELEPWVTWKAGRENYYSRFDHRLELELGVTDNLTTAIYVNFTGLTERASLAEERVSSFDYKGVSSEWKYKLLDPVADPIGLAGYLEVTLEPTAVELEEKIIVDKRIGNALLAGNLVFEQEMETEHEEIEVEHKMQVALGGGYFVSEHFMLGAEFRSVSLIEEGEHEATAFYLGPTLAWATERYWVALNVSPQLAAVKADDAGDSVRDLVHNEAVHARLLIGVHF